MKELFKVYLENKIKYHLVSFSAALLKEHINFNYFDKSKKSVMNLKRIKQTFSYLFGLYPTFLKQKTAL